MNSPLNSQPPQSVSDDLTRKAARFGAFGWIVAFVLLIALIVQNLIYSLMPKEVMASEDGVVVGQVVFNEPMLRHSDAVAADIKDFVMYCTSVNKHNVYDDLSVCLNHLESELADARTSFYTESGYAQQIEVAGCDRTTINFTDQDTQIDRSRSGGFAEAKLSGDIVCIVPGEKPTSQSFSLFIVAKLVPKTTNRPLGIEVVSYEDI